ncbi:uncharacterized protein LOC133378765 [Rhineura floridana]|uniref:uncharacterized protein LOC133378765 n=1 Tax=Rhineura floridana TaxID=261503 RepID=UPI002AC84A70|nr:uncharacterized protein LOC133378765 [Rhineura floridana]
MKEKASLIAAALRPQEEQGQVFRPRQIALGRNQCAYCKKEGHWKNECPDKPQRKACVPVVGAGGQVLQAPQFKSVGTKVGSCEVEHEFLLIPSCPIPLIGRDLFCKVQATLSFHLDGRITATAGGQPLSLTCPLQEAWRLGPILGLCASPTIHYTSVALQVIRAVPGIWAEDYPGGLAKFAEPLRIDLKDDYAVVNQPQYTIPADAKVSMHEHLGKLIQLNVLVPIVSAWNTPLLPVKKPSLGPAPLYRPVQDLRLVNQQIKDIVAVVANPYSLISLIPGGSLWYSVIDLKDAFFTIPLHPDSQAIFAFTWEHPHTGQKKQFAWSRLPQGFKNSPTLFGQQLARDLQRSQEEVGLVLQYVDDLLLPRQTREECLADTVELLRWLEECGYRASKAKAQICSQEVTYLGFIIKKDTCILGASRTQTIGCVPRPTNKKELRVFLGMAGYCCIWILDYASLTKPLYDLLKGKIPESYPLEWTSAETSALRRLKQALTSPPALGLPDITKPFQLLVDERKGTAVGVLTQCVGNWNRPVAYLSKNMDPVSRGWPGCLRSIAAASLLLTEATKLTYGQSIEVTAPHSIQSLLEVQGPKWMTNSRLVKYRAQLCENPHIMIRDRTTLNPATLMPLPEEPVHQCEEVMSIVYSSQPDLKDVPIPGEIVLFTDGSSSVIKGTRHAGYAVVTEDQVLRAEPLPPNTSAQKAELIALIEALKWAEEKKVTVYTDSKYAFLTVQVHGALYRERGFLTAEGKEIAHAPEIRQLLEAVWKPFRVAVIHCRAHTGKADPIARGNARADRAAKEAALKPLLKTVNLMTILLPPMPSQLPYTREENEEGQEQGYTCQREWYVLPNGKIWVPQRMARTAVFHMHNQCHLGKEALRHLIEKTMFIDKLASLCAEASRRCVICARNNPRRGPVPEPGQILRGSRPFQVIQIDFTHMSPAGGYKLLLVTVCTFSRWVEAWPVRSEGSREVVKHLLEDIIPRYSLPKQINSDNGAAFQAEMTEKLSKALGLDWKLHCAWRPQSSGAVERANQTLKLHLRKMCAETRTKWIQMLPVALLHMRCTPGMNGLTPYEMVYGRPPPLPIVVETLALRGEVNLKRVLKELNQTVLEISQYTEQSPLGLTTPVHGFSPGDSVWVKSYKEEALGKTWEGPFIVLLTTPTALKVEGNPVWIHWSRIKLASADKWAITNQKDLKMTLRRDASTRDTTGEASSGPATERAK